MTEYMNEDGFTITYKTTTLTVERDTIDDVYRAIIGLKFNLKSIEKTLNNFIKKQANNKPITKKECDNFMSDMCLWYCLKNPLTDYCNKCKITTQLIKINGDDHNSYCTKCLPKCCNSNCPVVIGWDCMDGEYYCENHIPLPIEERGPP